MSREVQARVEIADLVARYNANGDAGRFDEVLELFAADATMDVGDGRTYAGRDEIRSIFTTTATKVASYVRHFTATHQVDLVHETTATGRCYYQVVTAAGLDHWGRYLDEYRLVDGRWRFGHRRVTVDGHDPASAFVR